MKSIIEHGKFYYDNKIVKCICGCKFEYETEDIDIGDILNLAMGICNRYVECPECKAKIILNTKFKHQDSEEEDEL